MQGLEMWGYFMATGHDTAVFFHLALMWTTIHWGRGALPDFCTAPDLEDEDHASSGRCIPDETYRLARLDGVRMNHSWTVEMNSYKSLTVRTLRINPQVIEIRDFLSAVETDHITRLARKQGLTVPKLTPMEKYANEPLPVYDLDDNGKLSLSEMRYTIGMSLAVSMDEKDVLEMYDTLGTNTEANGDVSLLSLHVTPRSLLDKYLTDFVQRQPERQFRYSQAAGFRLMATTDGVLSDVLKRLSKVLELPIELLRFSDFEVAKFGVKGHSYPQYDSQSGGRRASSSCCPLSRHMDVCRVCRFLTVSFFLNDVDKGGETSFYFLEDDGSDEEVVVTPERLRALGDCGQAGLRVRPKRGTLLLWYNHFLDPESGWLGAMDTRLLHGHCPVLQGEKWVASLGVRVTQSKGDDLEAMNHQCA